jgi:hypothetical protein
MIIESPSLIGEVSITDRGWPLCRPIVVSSSTGMPIRTNRSDY